MNAEDKRAEIIDRMLRHTRITSSDSEIGNDVGHREMQTSVSMQTLPEPIAIIGVSGYFPQCMNVKEYWDALDHDLPLIEEIPAGRINWESVYDPSGKDPGKSHTKWGGVIPNIRNFDPQFFGILPSEAATMDPRKRLLLSSVYHALEDACYAPNTLRKSRTGVFIAVEDDEHEQYLRELGINPKVIGYGNSTSLIANQLSYFFDFRGPSEVIDTMCSGGAVAIHRAVRALRSGEISLAVVGAANILLHADPFIALSRIGQMSPVNSISSFGKDAKGWLRADGVASVILKPLSKAIADKDPIYATIRNSAVNYNGKGGMSIATPNISAHVDVIRSCYEEAGIDPARVGYIEAQGMGNPVADIAEWEACNRALKAIAHDRKITIDNGSCRISTLKPTTGHMHATSALGSLFKIIRSFQTNKIHKILGLTEINPDLDLNNQPCRLATETEQWKEEQFPRLAGLHSYGSGGNNAHILIEEYKGHQSISSSSSEDVIIPLSAATEEQCRKMVNSLLEVVATHSEYELRSIAHTLQIGRDVMKHKIAFVARSHDELINQCKTYLETGVLDLETSGVTVDRAAAISIAAAWMKGEDVSWDRIQYKLPANRLHFPVYYSFNDQDCWTGHDDHVVTAKTETQSAENVKRSKGSCLKCENSINGRCAGNKNGTGCKKIGAVAFKEEGAFARAEQIVRDVLSFFLRIPPADIELGKQFSAMGFDSLLVTNLTHRFYEQYGLKLQPAIFFEQTSPRQLIEFLILEFKDQFGDQRLSLNTGEIQSGTVSSLKDRTVASDTGKSGQTTKYSRHSEQEHFPVAIIGVSGRFPEAASIDQLWLNLVKGKDSIDEVPTGRWSVGDHFHPDKEMANKQGKSYGKWGGFLEGFCHFDPSFFNITPAEAELMSPKERLFLECAWHAVEDAGYTSQTLRDEKVGVFSGVTRGGIDPYRVSPFTISNRVSYVMNFNGPSMTIDTACSSSLVAIHEACQHIYTGECSVALAGGVHVFLDASHFSILSSMYMLSPDGTSKPFGDNANGMVPGEGVGIVMLKPLQKAILDGDHIYGVIKGSATNHGGKTNGFTVPNPQAHRDLVQDALAKSAVSAREISYVEAHGTGTSLGDPIEIRGLTEAFKKDTFETAYCRIGSLKSNIGHLEAAAGVSGLVKILLQMKYRKLVPSLHSETLNPQIDFSKTPFIVQQGLEDWNPTNEKGIGISRIACLSSFGAGGTNAHVVVEEYVGEQVTSESTSHPIIDSTPSVVLLSARNEDRLKEQAKLLHDFLKNSDRDYGFTLTDLAYTLQVGRVALEERLAMEVSSIGELEIKLEHFLTQQKSFEKIYRGNRKENKETIALFSNESQMADVVDGWVRSGNVAKLLSYWVKGVDYDWRKMYAAKPEKHSPRRISLPGYPFTKEFYGLPPIITASTSKVEDAIGQHPLVHKNTSTFSEQKFSTAFTGEEFFLKDHVVNGERVLPGVAYLEMVNKAIQLADGELPLRQDSKDIIVQLKNVAWIQPIIVREPVQVDIVVSPEEDGSVNFEITSRTPQDSLEKNIHSSGNATFIRRPKTRAVDIAAMTAATDIQIYTAEECYAAFSKMGIAYGAAHKGIEKVYVRNGHLLAKLVLPSVVSETEKTFQLHPSLLDSALQAIAGFMIAEKEVYADRWPLPIPFALGRLTVLSQCTSTMWASIRMNGEGELTGNEDDFDSLSFDIDLTDESGNICVQFEKYTARILETTVSHPGSTGTIIVESRWEEDRALEKNDAWNDRQRIVIVCKENRLSEEEFGWHDEDVQLVELESSHNRIDDRVSDYTLQLLTHLRVLMKDKPAEAMLLQFVVRDFGEERVLKALFGLIRTAHIENPSISGQLINVGQDDTVTSIASMLKETSSIPGTAQFRFVNGQRQRIVLRECLPVTGEIKHPWKQNGVYLITGGMGGLGLIFANEILRQIQPVTLILTGRAAPDEKVAIALANLRAYGGVVDYRQIDVSHEDAVVGLIGNITQLYGGLNGIIHCAGVIKDSFILKNTGEHVLDVLAPKVQGLVNLDLATRYSALDFFVLCSSSTSVLGNVGQGDYAVANAFMDEYALYRNSLVSTKKRHGLTVAVNWPLWKQGGMQVDREIEQMISASIGMIPMEESQGLKALYQVIASGSGQMMVLSGNLRKIRTAILQASNVIKPAAVSDVKGNETDTAVAKQLGNRADIKDKAVAYFKKLLAGVIKLPADSLETDMPMEEYGIDSIMVMKLTRELENVFGSLPKTLFFEYQNIGDLSEYFLSSYTEKLYALLDLRNPGRAEEKPGIEAATHSNEDVHVPIRNRRIGRLTGPGVQHEERKTSERRRDIAIIGLAGRYPKARTINEFWDNLCEGKNCVTEVPSDRWDHNLYFDADKDKVGKTYTKWGGFMDGMDEFDPLFFNMSPKDAEVLDPQERLFLQCAHAAVEDAGYTRETLGRYRASGLNGNVGVYVGVMWEEYQLYGAQETAFGRPLVLSSSPSSIANRVSYYFNLHGPSIAVDTMCSSSLTSIHLACQSLQNDECEVAIAGGVNVSLHPNKFLVLGYGRFASSKGLCESFGVGGDGYVPGEGVGAVLLKPLAQAIADNDQIYGVIKGSAVNHGGKANGFTVPNPSAQANVIDRAMKMAGFDPRTISYLEAHGTGTALGDPIEIAGLSKAFNSKDTQYCAIGSVKSNIGHCESAAGISGLTKVLLQMKYRQLVPSLHSAVLNSNIDFKNTPFLVQQELAEWKRPVLTVETEQKEWPRRAGISSFGAGGSNSHILVEEYIPESGSAGSRVAPLNASTDVALVVLSAKNTDRLKEQVKQLLTEIRRAGYSDKDLPSIAYTLQVGREAMEQRMAIIVSSISELTGKLAGLTEGDGQIENVIQGKAKLHKDILSFFTSDDDMEKTIENWIQKRKYEKLLGLWVNGFDIDWQKLHVSSRLTNDSPRRMSLPTYPFVRDRYWPDLKKLNSVNANTATQSFLHPLVHQNTSTFSEQKFSSTFSGYEFFLKDHVIKGQKLLPGVTYIEMVSQAMLIASEQTKGSVAIENMVWAKPLMVNGSPKKISIAISPDENGENRFEVNSETDTIDHKRTTHSDGIVKLIDQPGNLTLDIGHLKTQTNKVLTGSECYAFLSTLGIDYGPSQQAIENIYVGDDQLLAHLVLPDSLSDTLDQYTLHPSLMDASLQSLIGFSFQYADPAGMKVAIPFSVKSVTVAGPCTPRMWAFVRRNGMQDSTSIDDIEELSFDIDVADESGRVCVQLRGLTTRFLKKDNEEIGEPGILMIEPDWYQKEAGKFPGTMVDHLKHIVVVIENDAISEFLGNKFPDARILNLNLPQPSLHLTFENYALAIFSEVKQLLSAKLSVKTIIQVVVPLGRDRQILSAIAGLLKTAHSENPLFSGQIIFVEQENGMDHIADCLKADLSGTADTIIRHDGKRREVFVLRESTAMKAGVKHCWKDRGVYLITGGAGGLGLIIAREIAVRTKNAAVVLTGRSPLTAELQMQLEKVRSYGITVEYKQSDVVDIDSVQALTKFVLHKYGNLHGIIHSAGILRDNFILKKTEAEVKEVFASKVTGISNLDIATKEVALDFIILCSSTSGVTGNAGQADYAMANGYLDWFARGRNMLVAGKQRSGMSISVNWPLWKEGGMQVTKANEELMFENFGMTPLDSGLAFDSLYKAMATGSQQLMLLQGDRNKLRTAFLKAPAITSIAEPLVHSSGDKNAEGVDTTDMRTKALAYFTKILSVALKLSESKISVDKPMEEYGIDSVLVIRMTNELEKIFGSLSKTLFFEYQTIRELTEYFEAAFPEKLDALIGMGQNNSKASGKTPVVSADSHKGIAIPLGETRFKMLAGSQKKMVPDSALDIAIVGLSGSYPQARDIATFWKVLKEGKNCITEVPSDRWDHNQYFDAEKNKTGKTYGRWGGFIEGVDEFDPLFFGITPKEAEIMDPQERLFLQCVYEALEDAGFTKDGLGHNRITGSSGNVGVFVGVMNEEYQLFGAAETALGRPLVLSGNSAAIANRISYFFNLNGPSIALNTMCSSSLTTVHLACQSLILGECEAAIAGGVNVTLHPNKYVSLSYGNFLSTDGLCKSFGSGGDGYVPGEGVGAIILKPLAKAIGDNDHIYGVIKGTAVNHGGKTNGYTVPNPKAQTNVIGKAMKVAGFEPHTISYLEAHGTGTRLGDPIEITGLNKAFNTDQKQFCALGSVKSNVGHCEGAAGIAGITKVLLQMKYRQLVPSLHATSLNPNIDFENSPFVVQRELTDWKRGEYPRRAGVSAFGAGGANAHVLIEEYIPADNNFLDDPNQANSNKPAIIVLSAKTPQQLKQKAERLVTWIQGEEELSNRKLADMAYTLQIGREAMDERMAVIATTFAILEQKLIEFVTGKTGIQNLYTGRADQENKTFADNDIAHAFDYSIKNNDHGKLLDLWIKGLTVDWNKLYTDVKADERPARISLPTYPFARKRCWFSRPVEEKSENAAESGSALNGSLMSIPVMLEKQWRRKSAVVNGPPCKYVGILYTHESKNIATKLAQQLPTGILIDIADLEIFNVNQPDRKWGKLDGLIDVTGYGNHPEDSLGWIKLIQYLIARGNDVKIQLLCVTRGLTAFENRNINLAGATHAGLFRMLGSEYSHVISRQIDVDRESTIDVQVDQIVKELSVSDVDTEICYRGETRYVPQLTEIPVSLSPVKRFHFSPEQVLWITGGTRGLGYLCACHFVKHYGVRRLVLSGQEAFPPRDQWDSLCEQDSTLAQKIRNVLALEKLGVAVRVVGMNNNSLAQSVNDIKESWGAIHGVIHCAGVADHNNPAFIRKSLEDIRKVMVPKIAGLNTLYDCMHKEPLSFFVLFSSVSGVIPSLGAGQAAYSMANAYMDHFAESRSHDCSVTSLQWPNWKETGMGEVKTKAYHQTGLQGLTDAEGLELLDIAINRNAGPVVLPAFVDRTLWHPHRLLHNRIHTERTAVPLEGAETRGQQPRESEGQLLTVKVRDWLTNLFSRELKLEASDLRVDKPFQDYGIDSILIMQLLDPIKKALEQDVDPSILYEYTTIKTFSEWLVMTYPQILSRFLMTEVDNGYGSKNEVKNGLIPSGKDIAVIGLTCRFPGAPDLEKYWRLLSEGSSGIDIVPEDRWHNPRNYAAGMIEDPYGFDAKFFLMHNEDAEGMDPQALVVLEESLKLFYHAGYTTEEIKGKAVGVYLGGRSKHSPEPGKLASMRNPIVAAGQNYLSANVSQFFDLRGPSLTVDTACSSALVGMNMAVLALQHGEIESAVVGGVSLLASDETHRLFEQRGILGKGKDFHLFDQRANGIVLGEGIGLVMLKTVERALLDGDEIYATIKSVAINNDGRTAGPATPNIQAQKDVMHAALNKAGKKPEEIAYIEVNGSGSEVTDLIELKAISSVYRASAKVPCGLGSVKPNIGHPLCAEGIASFIKVVLMLNNKRFVPFRSGHLPMKYFDISSSPFEFSRVVRSWPDAPYVAAVNCFADGGTNAHVILEAFERDGNVAVRKPLAPPPLNRKDLRTGHLQPPAEPSDFIGDAISDAELCESVWESFK